MANRIKLTPHAREKFFEVMRETANVSEAARTIDVSRAYVYEVRAEDPGFAKAWEEAEQEAADRLEREALRRAVEGWDEPVFHKGEQCGKVRKYSDRMLELLLKARRPESFKERKEVTGRFTLEDLVGED